MSGDQSVWTTDEITLALLRCRPGLAARVMERMSEPFEFLDDLGEEHCPEGAIEKIVIKAWNEGRIIHSVHFRDGSRLGDLRFRLADMRPLPETLRNAPCSRTLGHPMFEGYTWSAPDGSDHLIEEVGKVRLGCDPAHTLGAMLATRPTDTMEKD